MYISPLCISNNLNPSFRYCLKELFSLPEEIESCIGTMEVGRIIDKDFLEEEMKLYDVITKCQEDFKLNILPKRKCKFMDL